MRTSFTFLVFALALSASAGTSPVYKVTDIPSPPSKFNTQQIDGLDFLPDGRLVVCLPSGEIFYYDTVKTNWHLFAEGLHNPLGVVALSASELVVSQRPELTRVRDTDGDGKADDFEAMSAEFGMSGNYHEFHFTPVRDKEGAYYFALGTGSSGNGIRSIVRSRFDERGRPGRMHASTPYRGCVLRWTPDGKTVPWAYGLRTPNGLGWDLEGNLFVTDNQGDWVGTSKLFHVKRGRFYGHAASLTWKKGFKGAPLETDPEILAKMRTRAAVVFPHGVMANSPTKVLAITPEAKFGPFTGQLLVGEMNQARIMRVMLEKVGGELQGAAIPFIDGKPLDLGVNRLAWAPDGSLYVGHTKHTWVGNQGIQRVEWNGKSPFEVRTMELMEEGFRFTFTQPVDKAIAARKKTWNLKRFHYYYHVSYGCPPIDTTDVEVDLVDISPDGKTVDVYLKDLQAWHIYEAKIAGLKNSKGHPLPNSYVVYTLNRLHSGTPPDPLHLNPKQRGKPKKKVTKQIDPIEVKNPKGTVYQASIAKRKGPALQNSNTGFTGSNYADFGKEPNSLEWMVTAKKAGEADLIFRYALMGGARPLKLFVNGKAIETLPFAPGRSWTKWIDLSYKASLKPGRNAVRLESTGKSGPNIDHLQVVEP
ncbi:MAG: DUF7133 domain-containing protein [Limisphaerales bacterium]